MFKNFCVIFLDMKLKFNEHKIQVMIETIYQCVKGERSVGANKTCITDIYIYGILFAGYWFGIFCQHMSFGCYVMFEMMWFVGCGMYKYELSRVYIVLCI